MLDGEANRGHSRPVWGRLIPERVGAKLADQQGSSGGRDPPGLPPSRHSHLGWQPTRFLSDRAEAERVFQLAERLGSVNAAATQLDTTWPTLRKAFTRHGLGMPARNPEAVRQRAIAAARHRTGQPAPQTMPPLDAVFVALNRGQLPTPRGPQPEQGVRLRRAEEIETLSYRTVVGLNQESRLAPRWRIATIARRAERAQRLAGVSRQRQSLPLVFLHSSWLQRVCGSRCRRSGS